MASLTKAQVGIVWDEMKHEYDSCAAEVAAVKEFVCKNPFPEMKAFVDIVPLQIEAELSTTNYELCKRMYETIWDEDVLTDCSELIFNSGGPQALVQMYYLLYNYSPLCANIITQSFARSIEFTWEKATDGVLMA